MKKTKLHVQIDVMTHPKRIFLSVFYLIASAWLLLGCEEMAFWEDSAEDIPELDTAAVSETDDEISNSDDRLDLERVEDEVKVTNEDTAEAGMEEVGYGSASNAQVSQAKQWRIVVSSQPSMTKAENFISRHKIPQAEILYVEKLDTYRVVYASFHSLPDAQQEFERISGQFPEAWMVNF